MQRLNLPSAILIALMGLLFSFLAFRCHNKDTITDLKTCYVTNINTDTLQLEYEYNDQNRVVRINNTSPAGAFATFTQDDEKVTILDFDKNGLFVAQTLFYLNNEGNVDTIVEMSNFKTYIQYDENGYLESIRKVTDDGYQLFSEEYFAVDGNINFVRREGGFGTIHQWTYEHYANTEHKGGYFNIYDKSLYVYLPFPLPFGKASKNILKKTTEKLNGEIIKTINYEYELNSEGYVSKMTGITGSDVDVALFTYRCQ